MIFNLIKLLVLLHVLLRNHAKYNNFMVMGLSKEEFFEVEKELQVGLNKSSGYVKTIQLEGGDIVDCIEMDKQPSLNHPSLKNHKIQMMRKQSKTRSKKKAACPPGTVPIPRIPNKHLFISIHSNIHKVEVGTAESEANAFRGGTGVVSVYGLRLTKHQISSANILVTNGPPEQRNVIMAGWMVAPSIYGDSATRLFTYWTQDTGRNTGCYNLLCKGFVIASPEVAPGALLSPVSTYNGTTYDFKIRIFQDPNSQNWVLTVFEDDIVVGYWPKELVPHLLNGAGYVGWGGLAKEGKGRNRRTSPPMGSGHKPDGNFSRAAYFKHIRCYAVDLSEIQISYGSSKEIVDDTGCYGLQNDMKQSPNVRDHFLFGGPGGKCGP